MVDLILSVEGDDKALSKAPSKISYKLTIHERKVQWMSIKKLSHYAHLDPNRVEYCNLNLGQNMVK